MFWTTPMFQNETLEKYWNDFWNEILREIVVFMNDFASFWSWVICLHNFVQLWYRETKGQIRKMIWIRITQPRLYNSQLEIRRFSVPWIFYFCGFLTFLKSWNCNFSNLVGPKFQSWSKFNLCRVSKSAIFTHLEALRFEFCELVKAEIYQIDKD